MSFRDCFKNALQKQHEKFSTRLGNGWSMVAEAKIEWVGHATIADHGYNSIGRIDARTA